ncbi:hypothetical protein F4779DRAFT_574393 [Xylariaceae sp. FL0662B]|nr:hypothetical protein F4779DRAFT_574393 [Xylariaceae sp. FL0662B]
MDGFRALGEQEEFRGVPQYLNSIPDLDSREAQRQAARARQLQRQEVLEEESWPDNINETESSVEHDLEGSSNADGDDGYDVNEYDSYEYDSDEDLMDDIMDEHIMNVAVHQAREDDVFGQWYGQHNNVTSQCVVCEDSFNSVKLCRLNCGHSHCTPCIKANMKSSLESMPFTPAKCCQVISRETLEAMDIFSADELKQYVDKLEEFSKLPYQKLYCWGEDCGAYIPAANYKMRVGECEQCNRKTCKSCRQKSHFGPCDKEKLQDARHADDQIFQLAASKGWKRCPNCLNIIQKKGGCDHMSCNCGQSFCYKCGQAIPLEINHRCAKGAQI